jgi:hypothetical protein
MSKIERSPIRRNRAVDDGESPLPQKMIKEIKKLNGGKIPGSPEKFTAMINLARVLDDVRIEKETGRSTWSSGRNILEHSVQPK